MSESRRITPLFKWAFFTLLGLTIVLFVGAVVFSVLIPNPTASQDSVEGHLLRAGYFTLTALVGLFIGKVS